MAKIDFELANDEIAHNKVIANLQQMLLETDDDYEKATLHYELYKMNAKEEYKQIALKLYKKLYKKTLNIEYKKRVEELSKIIIL